MSNFSDRANGGRRLLLLQVAVGLMIVVAVAGVFTGLIISFRVEPPPVQEVVPVMVVLLLVVLNGIIALLILKRHPGHAVGWMLLAMAFLFELTVLISTFEPLALIGTISRSQFAYRFARWLGGWVFLPQLTIPLMFLPLYFPTGRLPSPRWRVVAAAGGLGLLLQLAAVIVHPGPYEALGLVAENPLRIGNGRAIGELLGQIATPLSLAGGLGATVSMAVRYWRADLTERQQMKWLFLPLAIGAFWFLVVVAPLTFFGTPELQALVNTEDVGYVDAWLLLAAIPVAIGIAILRHRLFDIDLIIRKTLVYGLLTGTLILIYALVVGGTTTALQTKNNTFLTVLALGIAAAAFVPARHRLNALVNRYFPYERHGDEASEEQEPGATTVREGAVNSHPYERALRAISRVLFILSVVLTIAGISLSALSGNSWVFTAFVDSSVTTAIVMANGIVALLILTRHPRHVVGWFVLSASLAYALLTFSRGIVSAAEATMLNFTNPVVDFSVWLGFWIFYPAVINYVIFIPLYFPDGRLLSRRWIIFAALALVSMIAGIAGLAFHPGQSLMTASPYPNPYDIGLSAELTEFLFSRLSFMGTVAFLGGIASILIRFRRLGPVERAQVKWVFYALVLVIGLIAVNPVLVALLPEESVISSLVNIVGILLLFVAPPAAIGAAILRYRLYEIDVIIRKTLVYGLVTAGLASVYFGSVLLLQQLSAAVSGEQSPIIIVVSTLLIAALFSRLRGRAQEFIDRRFYRSKYDAAQTLSRFAQAARNEMDLDALTAELVSVVQTTMQPETVSVWLRDDVAQEADQNAPRPPKTSSTRPWAS